MPERPKLLPGCGGAQAAPADTEGVAGGGRAKPFNDVSPHAVGAMRINSLLPKIGLPHQAQVAAVAGGRGWLDGAGSVVGETRLVGVVVGVPCSLRGRLVDLVLIYRDFRVDDVEAVM